ncbi:MAG: hypothetical protein KAI66_10950 [Lentisphaeria bacterium]|nr:hypothetical protein [Lentisphaeria bacterium]
MISATPPIPPPPTMAQWTFVEELAQREPARVNWALDSPANECADLSGGVRMNYAFPDPEHVLDTVHEEMGHFFADVGLGEGTYEIVTAEAPTEQFEAFRIKVTPQRCVVEAADTEGIRRALYFLCDELRRATAPQLALGMIERRPHVHTRISRCCHGPKNRPGDYATKPGMPNSLEQVFGTPEYDRWKDEPEMRDELFDDREYFPEAYLARLAADAVNGLWVTGMFWQLCRTPTLPGFGPHSERRMAHLRRLVARCARYGIKIYLFCIEPRATTDRNMHAELPAEMLGHLGRMYCTSTPLGQQALDECVRFLFSECPGLGGLINLCIGERGTHCHSSWLNQPNTCPRCSKRDPYDVLSDTLTIMEKAMHETAPEAQLIAWPYSQYLVWGIEKTRDYAPHVPEGVTLMHNFESAGECEQLGKMRRLDDYWLAWPGPSQLFRDCAEGARTAGRETGAKIQTGCSYEMATVPFVPVPGNLWRKYSAIRELGVGTVMQCWLVGSFPSPMTKAGGELSFEPFPEDENAFMQHLATIDWQGHQDSVGEAWRLFGEAYRNYPFSRIFSYYSPMNNGPVWPLHLIPRDIGLQPPFRANRPPSGDRIGECLGDALNLREALLLCKRMRDGWATGIALLEPLRAVYADNAARLRDIAVCEAVGLQIRSSHNILSFYQLREELAWTEALAPRLEILERMRELVVEETQLSARLLEHAETDTRLGFQADSECHIYYPAKLRWRMDVLDNLIAEEFTQVEQALRAGQDPFAAYTARAPEGALMQSRCCTAPPRMDGRVEGEQWLACEPVAVQACEPSASDAATERATCMRACWDEDALYLAFVCNEPDMARIRTAAADAEPVAPNTNDYVQISLEPQRLWPVRRIFVTASGARHHLTLETLPNYTWEAASHRGDDFWSVTLRLPWEWVSPDGVFSGRPIRLMAQRNVPLDDGSGGAVCLRLHWPCLPTLLPPRLMQFPENPSDLGWCLL